MKMKNLVSKCLGGATMLMASGLALAGEVKQEDTFYTFYETIAGWTGGALGVGIAITMLLMGGAIGVAKNSPMPALTGVAGAAFFHWGPEIIESLILGTAVL